MAERKKTTGLKKKADVIDVGDKPAQESSDEEEGEEEKEELEEGLDADLIAAAAIDVGDEAESAEDVPEPKVPRDRGGSLARRDPLAAYMQETRRYPLLIIHYFCGIEERLEAILEIIKSGYGVVSLRKELTPDGRCVLQEMLNKYDQLMRLLR